MTLEQAIIPFGRNRRPMSREEAYYYSYKHNSSYCFDTFDVNVTSLWKKGYVEFAGKRKLLRKGNFKMSTVILLKITDEGMGFYAEAEKRLNRGLD